MLVKFVSYSNILRYKNAFEFKSKLFIKNIRISNQKVSHLVYQTLMTFLGNALKLRNLFDHNLF